MALGLCAEGIAQSVQPESARQSEVVSRLISKYFPDEFAQADAFSKTSTERGVGRWEHQHLIAALDTLNAYQRNRQGRASSVGGSVRRAFRSDPRTRLVEVLKRWLRTHASAAHIDEAEVRRVSGLCREVLNHAAVFPARNKRSFIQTVAEVYDHLLKQLREVLEQDKTCARLAQQVITLSKNFLSDVVGYLLVAATDLKQTDALPSMEIVALWQALPAGAQVPIKPDVQLQERMRPAFQTHCGALIAALVSTPSAVQLFHGCSAERPSEGPTSSDETDLVPTLIDRARADFDRGQFNTSGLAGVFRLPAQSGVRHNYLEAVRCVFDLTYLLGEAFVQFHRLGEGLGDYGMIKAAHWLHPFLAAVKDKVQRLRQHLEALNAEVDEKLVLASARRQKVEKPTPSSRMSARADEAIRRAVCGERSHGQCLLAALDELRSRSALERLPAVVEALGDACQQLQAVLGSEEFFAHVGDAHRGQFPQLGPADLAVQGGACPIGPWQSSIQDLSIEDLRDLRDQDLRDQGFSTPVPQGLRSAASELVGQLSGLEVRSVCSLGSEISFRDPDTSPQKSGGSPHFTEGSDEFFSPSPMGGSPGSRISSISTDCSTPRARDDGQVLAKLQMSKPQALAKLQMSRPQVIAEQPPECLHSQAWRLTVACRGFRRHDCRALALSHGRLHIFDKGSTLSVKTVADVRRDVEECQHVTGAVLSIFLRRKARSVLRGSDEEEHKIYFFELPSEKVAASFYHEIARLRQL